MKEYVQLLRKMLTIAWFVLTACMLENKAPHSRHPAFHPIVSGYTNVFLSQKVSHLKYFIIALGHRDFK